MAKCCEYDINFDEYDVIFDEYGHRFNPRFLKSHDTGNESR